MPDSKHSTLKRSNWRGFTLQLFLITILPLTVLLLVVAFGSQSLHHEAMRSLVGDRDLRTVRTASNTLEREIKSLTSSLQILSRSIDDGSDLSSLILNPEEISSIFDGGIALFTSQGQLIQSSTNDIDWRSIPSEIPNIFKTSLENNTGPAFSSLVSQVGNPHSYIFISIHTNKQELLLAAFSPEHLIESSIGNLLASGQTTLLVVGPSNIPGKYDVLFRGGPFKIDESVPTHPGIREVLNGESGINYYQSSMGEHVVAFNPIIPTGWGLVVEEAWEDIASPYLMTTQSAPLVIVPVFLLALFAIWFGARRIVTPLQKLEKQAADLASGDFEAINQPVGGIEEIQNLQTELMGMADKLKAAQQNLHSYIGAITAGIENERRSLARELHDDTIQALIAQNQRIQMILMHSSDSQKSALTQLQDLTSQTMINLRRMIRGLRPIYLEDLGLAASLDMLVHEFEQTANIPIQFTSLGPERRLDPQIEMALYRMVQESLNNVIQHAKAKHANVKLEFSEAELSVQVRDDGLGFVVPSNPAEFPEKGHFGLLGLQERSELINAELGIISELGIGTTISIRLQTTGSKN